VAQEEIQIVQINNGDEYLSNSTDGSKIYRWNGINQQLEGVYSGLQSAPIKIFFVESTQKIISFDTTEVMIWSLFNSVPEEKFKIPLEISKDLIAYFKMDGDFNTLRKKIELHNEVLYIGLGSVLVNFPYRKETYAIQHQFSSFINEVAYSEKGKYVLIEENVLPKRIHCFNLETNELKLIAEANGLSSAINPEGEFIIMDYYGQKATIYLPNLKKKRDVAITEYVGYSKPYFLNKTILLVPFADSSAYMINVENQFVSYMSLINGAGLTGFKNGYLVTIDQTSQEQSILLFDQFVSRRTGFTENKITTSASKQTYSYEQLKNKTLTVNDQHIQLPDRLSCLHQDPQKRTFMGTINGSFGQLVNGQFQLIDQISNSVTSLLSVDSLLFIGSIGRIVCYDLKNKKFQQTHRCHDGFVKFLSMTKDGRFLLSGGMDGRLFLWDESTHSLLEQYSVNEPVLSIQLKDDLSIHLLTLKDSLMKIENPNLLKKINSTELSVQARLGHSSSIRSMSLTKNGNYLASVDMDGVVKVWQTDQMIPIHTLQFDDGVTKVQFIEDGSTFFAFTGTSIMIIDTYSGKLIRKKTLPSYLTNFSILDVAAANNGRFFFITSVNSNDVWCYNLTTNYFGWFSEGAEPFSVKDIETIPGNDSLFVTLGQKGIYTYSALNGDLIRKIDHPNNSNQNAYVNYTLSFSPSGHLLLAYLNDSISVYDFKKGKLIRNLKGNFGFFHSDTALFVSGYFPDKKTHYYLVNPISGKVHYETVLSPLDYLTDDHAVDRERSIAYLTRNKEIQLINLKSGNYFRLNSGLSSFKTKAKFHPSDKNNLIVIQNKEIKIINRINGKKENEITLKGEDLIYNEDLSKYAVIRSSNAKVYASKNNELLYTLKSVRELIFTNHDRLIGFDFLDGIKIFNEKDGSILYSAGSFEKKEDLILSYLYSPIDREIIFIQSKGNNRANTMSFQERIDFKKKNTYITGVNISTGKVNSKTAFVSEFTDIAVSSTGQLAIRTGYHNIRLQSGNQAVDLIHKIWFENMFFSEDGNYFFVTGSEGQIECFETKSGKLLFLKQYHDKSINNISCHDSLLLTSGDDGKIILSRLHDGELIGTYLLFDDEDFVMIDAKNYYMGSHQGVGSICFKKGNKYYPLEQFDAMKNRPDLVLQSFGEKDPAILAAYAKAVEKRWKKLGVSGSTTKEDLSIPQLTILNKTRLPLITEQATINIQLKGDSRDVPLKCLQVWINDVPIYGVTGLRSGIEGLKQSEVKIDLELQSGENKIQFAYMNTHGVEGEKQTIYISYEPRQKIQKNLYLITLGVSKYRDSLFNLLYATKDAHDIGDLFLQNSAMVYDSVIHRSLTDDQLTRKNVLNLKSTLMKAGRNDAVIISFSGHGLLDENFNYYLATSDIVFNDPAINGLPYEELESLLDGIAPLKKVLLIDACHSGEVEKEDILAKTDNENTKDTFRGGETEYVSDESSINASELSKELFNDLRRGTGATVISASGGLELAREGSQWNNGLFTYCLLSGLNGLKADLNEDGMVMLNELQSYLQTEVVKLSDGQQKPTSRLENLEMDWRVW
jgi:WD40 repeat protein